MRKTPTRLYPRLYSRILSANEPPALREARLRVCPYKRESLIAAHAAGWHAWVMREKIRDYNPPSHLSSMAQYAWSKGIADRMQYEQSLTQGE